MIASTVVSPYLAQNPSAPQSAAVKTEQPDVHTPADVVTTTAGADEPTHLSFGQRVGIGLLAGVTVLGAGVLAPSTAQAQTRHHYSHSQVYHHGGHHGHRNDRGSQLGEAIVGGIIGGAIANGAGIYVPPPVYNPGYVAYGCDGVMHHFDAYGDVLDYSGHYRLVQDAWGNCYRMPPTPHY